MDLLTVVLLGIIAILLVLLVLSLGVEPDERTLQEVLAGVPRKPRKAATPEEAKPVASKHRTRGSGMFGERGTYVETDPLYKAIRSGLPIGTPVDEHVIALEIRRRVLAMVIDPLDKKVGDLEQQLRSVRMANRLLKEVAQGAKEEDAPIERGRPTNGAG